MRTHYGAGIDTQAFSQMSWYWYMNKVNYICYITKAQLLWFQR